MTMPNLIKNTMAASNINILTVNNEKLSSSALSMRSGQREDAAVVEKFISSKLRNDVTTLSSILNNYGYVEGCLYTADKGLESIDKTITKVLTDVIAAQNDLDVTKQAVLKEAIFFKIQQIQSDVDKLQFDGKYMLKGQGIKLQSGLEVNDVMEFSLANISGNFLFRTNLVNALKDAMNAQCKAVFDDKLAEGANEPACILAVKAAAGALGGLTDEQTRNVIKAGAAGRAAALNAIDGAFGAHAGAVNAVIAGNPNYVATEALLQFRGKVVLDVPLLDSSANKNAVVEILSRDGADPKAYTLVQKAELLSKCIFNLSPALKDKLAAQLPDFQLEIDAAHGGDTLQNIPQVRLQALFAIAAGNVGLGRINRVVEKMSDFDAGVNGANIKLDTKEGRDKLYDIMQTAKATIRAMQAQLGNYHSKMENAKDVMIEYRSAIEKSADALTATDVSVESQNISEANRVRAIINALNAAANIACNETLKQATETIKG